MTSKIRKCPTKQGAKEGVVQGYFRGCSAWDPLHEVVSGSNSQLQSTIAHIAMKEGVLH